jgi:hypothetical protein
MMADLKAMTDEELAAYERLTWALWMEEEAAERGYGRRAASEADDRHVAALTERELRRCRTISNPVYELIDLLAGAEKP